MSDARSIEDGDGGELERHRRRDVLHSLRGPAYRRRADDMASAVSLLRGICGL